MTRTHFAAVALAAACLSFASSAWAHAVCGNRVFPATLTIDDPGVGDELSLPSIQYAPIPGSAGGGQNTSYGFEWDKTITEHFGISIEGGYIDQSSGGTHLSGWDNIGVGLKYQFLCSDSNEFMASFGVGRDFAKTGSSNLVANDVIDATSSTTPTFYFGKGLGDLPIGWARAFAVTGEVGFGFSDSPNADPNSWSYGASLQYSIPYLQQHVKAMDLPSFLGNITPLVEVNFSTVANGSTKGQTTGTIAPGLLYDADSWQLGLEAVIPANTVTRQSQGVGFVAQLHFFLDDIFPTTIGKPLFGGGI
jgi:hypothetical protein